MNGGGAGSDDRAETDETVGVMVDALVRVIGDVTKREETVAGVEREK